MPIITLEGPRLDKDKKEELVKGFTYVASKAMPQFPKRAFIVIIKENPDENIGVSGVLLSDMGNE